MKHQILIIICIGLTIFFPGCLKESPVELPQSKAKVEIISPKENSSVFDTLEIQVSVISEKPIVRVELYIDGQLDSSCICLTQPYVFTWVIPDEPDSTVHTLQAKAYESDNTGINSAILKVISYKFTPSNLQVISFSETSFSLAWQNNSKFTTGFVIEQSVHDSAFVFLDSVGSNIVNKTFSCPILTNTNYAFRVRAKAATAFSKYSNIATARILFEAPYAVQIDSKSDSTIHIYWQDTSSIKKSFEIERSTDGTSYALVKLVDASSGGTHYAITLIDNYSVGQLYYFRIRTKSINNYSPYSSIVDTSVVFQSPVGLTILSSTASQIVLKWANASRFTKSFRIEKQIGNEAFVNVSTVDVNTTTIIDSTLDASKIYHFRVRAESGNYFSQFSQLLKVQFIFSNNYTLVHTLSDHKEQAGNVAFAANDKIVVSSGTDRTVKFWDVNTGNLLRTISLHGSSFIQSPPFSIYNNLIAVGDSMNIINIYDIYSGILLKTLLTSNPNLITGISFSQDGEYLGAVNLANLTVWHVSDWSVVLEKNEDSANSISFSSDNKYVATGSTLSGKAIVYEVSTGNILSTLSTSGYYVIWAVAFSPDNENIAIGGMHPQVMIFQPTGGTPIESLSYGSAIFCLAYSPDGSSIAAGGDSMIKIWSQSSLVAQISEPMKVLSLSYSRDGRYLVSGNFDYNVRLYTTGSWIGSQ